ncbi:hypothetical protein CsSME_00010600 [Camellia sinensis var. sinensis]
MLRLLLLLVLFLVSGSTLVDSHKESGDWSCESDPEARVAAEFSPGLVTLDGHADDWKNVDGFEFSLLPALDPHPDHEYKGGKMIVKALHDGKDVYFMLQIDGDYVYSKGDGTKCPSVALMFQVGESATYHDVSIFDYFQYILRLLFVLFGLSSFPILLVCFPKKKKERKGK